MLLGKLQVHNIAFCSDNFCLNQERNMDRPSTVYKWKQSKTVLNKYVGGFWSEKQQKMDFFFFWMKRYYRYFSQKVMDWSLFLGVNYSFKWVIIFGPHDLGASLFQCFILFTFIFASSSPKFLN